jgi:hypothetical protein
MLHEIHRLAPLIIVKAQTEDFDMPRLTLRTLLAYIDDTLNPDQTRTLGQKVAESDEAKVLIERIKKVTRRRGLTSPVPHGEEGDIADPNTVAEYLSDNLEGPQLRELEETCLDSDVHLAEVAACHQILTLVLTTPVRVPPSANQRMYAIVGPPAGDPSQKPGKTIPVGGVKPREPDQTDFDDPDTALLLGMKRYGASDSWAGRIGLVSAVSAVALALMLAVLMALPHRPSPAPEITPATSYALVPGPTTPGNGSPSGTPVTTPGGTGTPEPKTPEPKTPEPKKEDTEPGPKKIDEPKKDMPDPKADPGPKLGDPVKPPLGGDAVVGEMKSDNVIVLTREPAPNAKWLRIDPASPEIHASYSVMAIPGFNTVDVKLNSGVVVTLWGNVPEQVSMKAMVMQSRVKFHPPDDGFAADITLETGRIYLKTLKPGGAKIRLRLATEVWDVALKNNQSDVFAQVNTAFVPGSPFARDGGDKPKTEVYFAVVKGTADLNIPARFKKIDGIEQGNMVTWDSKSNVPSGKKPISEYLYPDRIRLLEGESGKVFQRVLSDAAKNLTMPNGVWVLLKERLTQQPPLNHRFGLNLLIDLGIIFPVKFGAYGFGAIMDGSDTPEMLKDMVDALGDRNRAYARQAAVVTLSSWVAQAPGNTNLLVKAMIGKGWREEDADLIAHLLRGYSSAETGDTAAVDQLVEWLNYDQLAVREVALGNLLAFYDTEPSPDLFIDVALRREQGYEKAYDTFLKSWKTRAEEIKKKMMEKKTEKKP